MKTIEVQPLKAGAFEAFGSVAAPPRGAPLAETEAFRYWSDTSHYAIDGETEIGYCTVYPSPDGRVSWMERHGRTPEVIIPIGAPLVLPVMVGDEVSAFEVQPGEAAVLGTNVWHSACMPAGDDAVTYFVIFRRGTPAEDVEKRTIAPVSILRGRK